MLFTFISIHAVGIDFGILVGILIAVCDQILTTAQSTGVNRIEKRSRAVYTKEDAKMIHDEVYSTFAPKIVTLEIIGNLFFGSSLSMLNQIYEEVGLGVNNTQDTSAGASVDEIDPIRSSPKFVVLDLMGVTHLDASATRGCFLQLAKMAAKKNIIVCVSGLSPRIEWMFRSHEVSFETADEEDHEKAELLGTMQLESEEQELERILVFTTVAEALEFCETLLLNDFNGVRKSPNSQRATLKQSKTQNISTILSNFISATANQADVLEKLMDLRFHKEVTFKDGQVIFAKRSNSDAFYIVLNGCVANSTSSTIQVARQQQSVVSGAGKVDKMGSSSSGTIATLWQIGGVFGFNDYLLERKRSFQTIAMGDGTKLAIFTRSGMNTLCTQDPELYGLMQQVLLRASTLDLANCTCHDV